MTRFRYAALSFGVLATGFVGLLGNSPAYAQNTNPAVRNVPIKATETKVYGDWTLRCFDMKGPAPCDMFSVAE